MTAPHIPPLDEELRLGTWVAKARARRVVLLGMAHLRREAERQRKADEQRAHEQIGGDSDA